MYSVIYEHLVAVKNSVTSHPASTASGVASITAQHQLLKAFVKGIHIGDTPHLSLTQTQ